MKRVVVTGMGVISPLGNDIDTYWNHIKEEMVGIKSLDRFDATDYKVTLAAQIDDFNPLDYMTFKSAKRMDVFCQYAVAATKEAIESSRLQLEEEDPTRIGVSVGSGIGSLQAVEREHIKLLEKGPGRVSTLLVPLMISNMAAGNVAIHYGLKGKCINVVTACATGTHSIGEAYRAIQCNEVDVMIAGGTEASITPIGIAGFHSLNALTTATDLKRASIPFDRDRSGFVMGEGAGVVVLESYEHARKRNAPILAEVVGYGATCDAYHITSPCEDGDGAARAMMLAMKEANIEPKDVDVVNAHGTSTHLNDLYETRAIKKAFESAAYDLHVQSTKSMTGHMLGAAGAVEFITCVKELMEQYIHPTVGYQEKEEELDLDYTKVAVKDQPVRYIISNSLGFGGHNGSILLKKYEG